MGIGVTVIGILAVCILIYLSFEFKRFKHKLFAFFIIGLLVFSFVSAAAVFRGKDINFGTIGGLASGVKIYFSWLIHVGSNLGAITTNAFKMDWTKTDTSVNITKSK